MEGEELAAAEGDGTWRCDGCSTGCYNMHPTCILRGKRYRCPCIGCLVQPMCRTECDKVMTYFDIMVEVQNPDNYLLHRGEPNLDEYQE